MHLTRGYAVKNKTAKFEVFDFNRRDVLPHDVLIKIDYAGICHSDIHQARDEWGGSVYPMVPGHEIVGRVVDVGHAVTKFKVGDIAGVGCFVDSCRTCSSCREGEEQFCAKGVSFTYNSTEQDGRTPTYGGYSTQIVVDENYVLSIAPNLPLANVAPLLCAGITTYSPLKRFGVTKGQKVAIAGLGGLGHMGVKIAVAMGAEVSVLSHSPDKEADALKLGAKHFVVTKNLANLGAWQEQFDFILDTVSAPHDISAYLNLLKRDGTLALVGVPEEALKVDPSALIMKRRRLAGSLIGGIRETQEMLDFCASHQIVADIEMITPEQIDEAYARTVKSDVKYRFVIDMREKNI